MKSLSTWPAFAEDLKTLSIVVSMTNFAQTFPSWVNLILASVHFGSSLKHWYLDFIKRFLIISLTLTLTLNIDLNVKAMFLNQPSSWLKLCSSNGMVYCVLQSLHLEPNPHTEFTSIHSSAPRRRLNVWHPSLRSPLALSSLLNYKWIQHRQFVELVLSVPRFRNSLVSCWQTLKHNVGEMKKIKWPALSGLNVSVPLFLPHFLHKKQTLI